MLFLSAAFASTPWQKVRDELHSKPIALDLLARTTARWELDPEDSDPQGPRWSYVRARLLGQLGSHIDYALHGQAANQVALLDAWARWSPHPALQVRAGWFRPALTAESTQLLMELPFTDRSVGAQRLGPERDWGLGIAGNAGVLGWEVGIFQAGSLFDREALPMAVALTSVAVGTKRRWTLQVAGAATRDRNAPWAGTDFSGDRITGTAASSWTSKHVTLSAELQLAAYDPTVGRVDYPIAFQSTVQVRPTPHGELAVRFEGWSRTSLPGLAMDLVAGAKLIPFPEPRPPVQAMLNYRVPLHARRVGDQAVELGLQLWL